MAVIEWDKTGEREFEAGVDRGVLYFPDGGGVPWNGLISVNEAIDTKIEPIFFDGQKISEIVTVGNYSATLRAYTYPEEFMAYEGIREDQSGVFLTHQVPKPFHLSYRTRVGNDVEGTDLGYKIHVLWNLLAVPSTKTYETLTLDSSPAEFEWKLSSVPEEVAGYRPTSHLILDSRLILDEYLLRDIENILYGTDTTDPTLASMQGFTSFIRKWERIVITDNGDGTWTAFDSSDQYISMLDGITFQITEANATYSDADTYDISSTDKNEEDIWLP